MKRRTITSSKLLCLVKAQDHQCAYCNRRFDSRYLWPTFDHVVPRSKGGPDYITNGLAVCEPCNVRKADKMPTEAQLAYQAALMPRLLALYSTKVPVTMWNATLPHPIGAPPRGKAKKMTAAREAHRKRKMEKAQERGWPYGGEPDYEVEAYPKLWP